MAVKHIDILKLTIDTVLMFMSIPFASVNIVVKGHC